MAGCRMEMYVLAARRARGVSVMNVGSARRHSSGSVFFDKVYAIEFSHLLFLVPFVLPRRTALIQSRTSNATLPMLGAVMMGVVAN